ncbi:MAG TPA: transcription antitermination factor NusB [Gemmatimonadaceae bacterium]|nr:transcription antitermination factor NusB [Gemmatimonadaceae bacterium]
MATRRREHRARARALQALYASAVRGDANLPRIATLVFDDLCVQPEERELAEKLIRTIVEQGPALDASLERLTSNWRFERIGTVERCLLRLGAAELVRGETPPRVVLQEAVHLAELFGGAESVRFVNGVLDALARDMGRL